MKDRIAAEWDSFLWFIGWRKYCLPCDAVYGQLSTDHGHCPLSFIEFT